MATTPPFDSARGAVRSLDKRGRPPKKGGFRPASAGRKDRQSRRRLLGRALLDTDLVGMEWEMYSEVGWAGRGSLKKKGLSSGTRKHHGPYRHLAFWDRVVNMTNP